MSVLTGDRFDYNLSRWAACATHALPAHRAAGLVVQQIVHFVRTSTRSEDRRDKVRRPGRKRRLPFVVHAYWAARRGVQHRNTSRNIVRALGEIGLLRVLDYRPGRPGSGFIPTRIAINWSAVAKYERKHRDTLFGRRTDQPRTLEDWAAQMKAHADAEAEKERKDADDREKARKAQDAALVAQAITSPAERARVALKLAQDGKLAAWQLRTLAIRETELDQDLDVLVRLSLERRGLGPPG